MRREMALLLVLAASGCSTAREPTGAMTPFSRGHRIALAACSGCHAVEPGGVSAAPRAPGFASLEMQHTAGLEGRVAALTRTGHYAMPSVKLGPGEIGDLVAYIESLSDTDEPTRRQR